MREMSTEGEVFAAYPELRPVVDTIRLFAGAGTFEPIRLCRDIRDQGGPWLSGGWYWLNVDGQEVERSIDLYPGETSFEIRSAALKGWALVEYGPTGAGAHVPTIALAEACARWLVRGVAP